jgi:hypothetical protein
LGKNHGKLAHERNLAPKIIPGWRPSWKELGFLVSNCVDIEVYNALASADHLLIEILLSHPIGIVQIYDDYPWACL